MKEDLHSRGARLVVTSSWRNDWPVAYPRATGQWSIQRPGQWGVLDPELAAIEVVDPKMDNRLPGIVPALEIGHIVGYRPGRRAIVATPTNFVKILRPRRVDALVARHELLSGNGTFDVPAVIDTAPDGRVVLTRMSGRSLHDRLRSDPRCSLDSAGTVMADLHDSPVPGWLPPRTPDAPASWVSTSQRSPTSYLPLIERAAEQLPALEARAEVLVHGDLHDKNIFGDDTKASLIDLDGLALGAPEDDVANLAVHLELRNLQACTGLPHGARSAELYRSYARSRKLDCDRLRTVERHTWFRLACLYQYRTSSAHLVPQMLRLAVGEEGQQHGGLRATEVTLANSE